MNCFVDPALMHMHYDRRYRKRRLKDFIKIHSRLEHHCAPTRHFTIDDQKKSEYIMHHRTESQPVVKNLLDLLTYVPFDAFYKEAKENVKKLQQELSRKYVIVVGASVSMGPSRTVVDIEKSNFWMVILCWKFLKRKPYDVVFNLEVAMSMYADTDTDYVLLDDCSYSGTQIVSVLRDCLPTHLLGYSNPLMPLVKVKKPLPFTVYLVIPYMSTRAHSRLSILNMMVPFTLNVISSVLLHPYEVLVKSSLLQDARVLQRKCSVDLLRKVPVYFQHKIADDESTVNLILTRGTILDDPSQPFRPFIRECIYNPDDPETAHLLNTVYDTNSIDCILPPYKRFLEILGKKN